MKKLLNRAFWGICRLLLRFRYSTKVVGSDQLKDLRGPTLVIPNHPAYIDPPLVSSHLRLHQPLRPLVFSGSYRMLLLRPLMALVDAFEVPDMSSQSRDAQAKALEMIDSVVQRLQSGDCMLIYPSGRLQRGNSEVVGAARAVHDIVSRVPDLNVVLVRTRGLWGSSFSCAATGAPPHLASVALRAFGWILASLGFFLPRREVELTIEVRTGSDFPFDSKETFNRYLEAWYNQDGPQEPSFVRFHHLLGPADGSFGNAEVGPAVNMGTIKNKTITQVNDLISSHLGRELSEEELQASSKLEDIGLDSLDRMDLALKIEHQFGFRSDTVAETMGTLWALADGQLTQATGPLEVPEKWNQPPTPGGSPKVLADTIARAFVVRTLKNPNDVVVADSLSGALTHRKMLVGALLMAKRFQAMKEKHVGIMLPATVAADVVFFALHLAGKIPVLMNWTTGPANLAHGVDVTELKHIVTSKKLIDRLGLEVRGAEFVFLEDIKQGIGKLESLATLLQTYLRAGSILNRLPKQEPDETAVFLFTSGSESLPKTVPLTHTNLIVNVGDGVEVLQATNEDSLLGFLPPFHSFGMTGNLLLSHLTGIKCIRYADPTDAAGLVRTIEAYRPTMVFTTPTFLGFILSTCKPGQLDSLKTIVTGAEKCPESIFARCKELAPNATILEGYGITECSPVVSANLRDFSKLGSVGRPVTHVDTCILDVDTNQPVPEGSTGMLLVSGPSIFHGYYRHNGPTPFVEWDGRQWYKTGDLVSRDEDGFLHFQGRLKRFLKAGGEMISLPALEEPLAKAYPADEHGPKVAVEGIETPDGRHIVLFTTEDISVRQANELILASGLRGVMRLDEVQVLDSIPVLGTGKTDYKELRTLVTQAAAVSSP